jgi:xanthine dehydrogenase molybdenum-binding subunit
MELQFTLNGTPAVVAYETETNLLELLRRRLGLTAAKDGCGEGQCGACTVLLDGRPVRACITPLSRVAGRTVTTLEGLRGPVLDAIRDGFTATGAVQCGFCTPGMAVAAAALLAKEPNPEPAAVRKALHGHICRCTGYVKIVDGVLYAGGLLRGEEVADRFPSLPGGSASERRSGEPVRSQDQGGIRASVVRPDAADKVTGEALYVDDMTVPGMLHAAVLRTPYPRALIHRIDTAAARALPGVHAVVTAADIPGERYLGLILEDWPAFMAEGEESHYVGDGLAAVAAETPALAAAALRLIVVDAAELDCVTNPHAALKPDAPVIHPGGNLLARDVVRRGDVDDALARAAHVITSTYTTPMVEHAFMEPESALAVPEAGGGLTIYASNQSVFKDQQQIAAMLGLPKERIRVVARNVGGAFGGKEDLSVQHHAALLAHVTGRPVKLTLARAESLLVHPKRHAMAMTFTTACDAEGRLVALRAEIIGDKGAYASVGGPVMQRAAVHATGPYYVPAVDVAALGVYTNNPPGGAFRGFGVNQVAFAMEAQMDQLAERVGISPWEIRWRNALDEGEEFATGQRMAPGIGFKETLLAVREAYEGHPRAGIACAVKNVGTGVGTEDIGRARIRVEHGRVAVYCGAVCLGQGLEVTLLQIVSRELSLPWDRIDVTLADTASCPDSGVTTASRQTVFSGEAARLAAAKLRADLATGLTLGDLDGQEYHGEFWPRTDPLGQGGPHPTTHLNYSFATQVVHLDENGRLERVIAAHDVGVAINPMSLTGQIEGAVAMGLGYALTEEFPVVDGRPVKTTFQSLGLLRAGQVPPIDVILIEKGKDSPAFGAKGIGEIACIPTAAAVAAAYYRWDGRRRFALPLAATPYRRRSPGATEAPERAEEDERRPAHG